MNKAIFRSHSYHYTFEVFPEGSTFRDIGGVYVFAKREGDSLDGYGYEPIYVGQTKSLQTRISRHEKWPSARPYGVDCVCVLEDDDESSRLQVVHDLIATYTPPCNN